MTRILFALLITALSASAQNLMPARQTDVSTNSFQVIMPAPSITTNGITGVVTTTHTAQATFDWIDDGMASKAYVEAQFSNLWQTLQSGSGTLKVDRVEAKDGIFTNLTVLSNFYIGTNLPPTSGTSGRRDIWFDTNERLIKFWDGNSWTGFGAVYL